MPTMQLTKITRNNQITIPKSIMGKRNLKVGDMLQVSLENGRIVVTPVTVKAAQQPQQKDAKQ